MSTARTPLVWLHGEIKTPPFTREARVEAGTLLRRLQEGERLEMPHSRPMPSIGPDVMNCASAMPTRTGASSIGSTLTRL